MSYLNRDEIIENSGLKDEKKIELVRLVDNLEHAINKYEVQVSDFITPDLLEKISALANRQINEGDQIDYSILGEANNLELSRIAFYPNYIEAKEIDYKISVICIAYNEKFSTILHKDVLGSLIGLGINRSKIGDIIFDDKIYVVVDSGIRDFIEMNLTTIGRTSVKIEKVDFADLPIKKQEMKITNTTIKSLRLDGVLSAAYNVSRSKIQSMIKSEKVKVNHRVVESTSFNLSEGDLLSLRGKGRVKIISVDGTTKKDRVKITIGYFI